MILSYCFAVSLDVRRYDVTCRAMMSRHATPCWHFDWHFVFRPPQTVEGDEKNLISAEMPKRVPAKHWSTSKSESVNHPLLITSQPDRKKTTLEATWSLKHKGFLASLFSVLNANCLTQDLCFLISTNPDKAHRQQISPPRFSTVLPNPQLFRTYE